VLPVTTRTVVAVLVGLGSALPLAGIVWAVISARAHITVLQHQRARLQGMMKQGKPGDEISDAAREEGIPVGSFEYLLSAPQTIELAVLRQFWGPITLAAAGLIAGGVGGIWSLYLPSV
jgi:hypothetical protein